MEEFYILGDISNVKLTKKQQIIVDYLSKNKKIKKSDVKEKLNIGPSVTKKLLEQNVIFIIEEEVIPEIDTTILQNETKLSIYQKEIFDKIVKNYNTEKFNEYLLHGVTGSGKTEIYIKLVEETLKNGKDAIVLVPEIILTPQIERKFKKIFNEKIFAKSKPDLLKKVAEYPDRYVGLFRPTKPEAKLLQNLLQSNEIRFGDAFEVAIKQYFINEGWQPLPQKITSKEGDTLDIDQLLVKDDKVLFIEQKVRDDHDSTKKRGQISNFEKKLEALIDIYGDNVKWGFFYFIDPSLVKNRNFYQPELQKLQESWGVHLSVSYGQDMFNQLDLSHIWPDIMNNLQKWRQDIPDLPNVNFDSSPKESAEEIKDLPLRTFRKLFDDERIVSQILPVLFPTGATLAILEPYFRAQNIMVTHKIADSILLYLQSSPTKILL